jgi:hypothetical protein
VFSADRRGVAGWRRFCMVEGSTVVSEGKEVDMQARRALLSLIASLGLVTPIAFAQDDGATKEVKIDCEINGKIEKKTKQECTDADGKVVAPKKEENKDG